VLSALVLLFTLLGGTAQAVPEDACIKDEKCKEHYTKGVKLYKEELFDDALTEFYRSRLLVPQVNPNTLARLSPEVARSVW